MTSTRLAAALALLVTVTGGVSAQGGDAGNADLVGAWLGTLNAGVMKLRVVFHFVEGEDGLAATLDVIEQGARGLPVTVSRNGPAVALEVAPVRGTFAGTMSASRQTIEGAWSQNGTSLPLVLRRVENLADLAPRRPQNPAKPSPYRDEEVAYQNASAGITLGGTLTLPAGAGPFPAVVLISGSGPQDRDETLMDHRPFLVLADHLTRRGVAVLRTDDRGVGKSGGSFAGATTADFAGDVQAAIAYLQTRPEVNQRKIGLIGHSEGGVIAPMVAVANTKVAFVVLIAGSGVPGSDVLVEQNALILQAAGAPRAQAEKNAAMLRAALDLVKQEPDNAIVAAKLREQMAGTVPPALIDSQIQRLTSPWMRYFISYDPAAALRQLACPVLALAGEKDLQVSPGQNLPAIRKALEAGGNKRAEVVELPGLNHLLQTARTGAPTEYAQIEETMAPKALELIASWVLKQ